MTVPPIGSEAPARPPAAASLELQVAERLGMRSPFELRKSHLGGAHNETELWRFAAGGREVAVVVKRSTLFSDLKWRAADIFLPYPRVEVDGAKRFDNQLAMSEAFRRAGLRVAEIVLADSQRRVIVTRFIESTPYKRLAREALAGSIEALAAINRLGAALAAAHRHDLTVGDLSLDNVLEADGEPVFIDVDQAGAGEPGWDLAQFLSDALVNHSGVEASRWESFADAFLSGYLEGGGAAEAARQALRPEFFRLTSLIADPKALAAVQERLGSVSRH